MSSPEQPADQSEALRRSHPAAKPAQPRWCPVLIEDVVVSPEQRTLDLSHVDALKRSFGLLGGQLQLQPIIVGEGMVLIDGAHRLEAARQAGWDRIGALVFDGVDPELQPIFEVEANRLRKTLSILELEAAWRSHYEPPLRADARRRQLAGLRRGAVSHSTAPELVPRETPVIAISNNGGKGASHRSSESLAKAARRITGYSMRTLDKVAQIRRLAASELVAPELRTAAEDGLRKLSKPGASVESVYRGLTRLHEQADTYGGPARMRAQQDMAALESLLDESTALVARLEGPLTGQLASAARSGAIESEMLRGVRVALMHAFVAVAVVESGQSHAPSLDLRRTCQQVLRLFNDAASAQQSRKLGRAA